MLATRTIIGLVVGSLVIGLGAFALVNSLAPTISMNENFVISPGASEFFTIPAPKDAPQYMMIIGDSFDLKLTSPGDGLNISNTSYKKELVLDWTHTENGQTIIVIQNTGASELEITANTNQTPDPFGITFDFMVITSGVVILGFSLGFTLRKPKGF
ncbi:MAG: hypothetical protein QMC57_05475 [Nitrosopumilus sp.]|jgi:hypothetical protein|tara:strand:- start:1439 stop:1909 length:471 start_codon:yes stop_codon:yes gene_type:complete